MLNRRIFTLTLGAAAVVSACSQGSSAAKPMLDTESKMDANIDWKALSKSDWKKRLNEEEFYVLRKEGTEPPFSSPLNDEKRDGSFVCAACPPLIYVRS